MSDKPLVTVDELENIQFDPPWTDNAMPAIVEYVNRKAEKELAEARKDSERLSIWVSYQKGDDPFVFRVNGKVLTWELSAIEEQLIPEDFPQGCGEYQFAATFPSAWAGQGWLPCI